MVLNCTLAIAFQLGGSLSGIYERKGACDELKHGYQVPAMTVDEWEGCTIDAAFDRGQDEEWTVTVKPTAGCLDGIRVDWWMLAVQLSGEKVENAFEPIGFGRLADSKFRVTFPSMQFTAAFTNKGCAYLGIHDEKAFPKQFAYDGVSVITSTYSGSAELPSNGLSSLPFKIQVIEGPCSWVNAADIYEKFASRTAWYDLGITVKQLRPDWIDKVPFWINTHWQINDVFETKGGNPTVVLERVKQFKELLGQDFPMFLHWYEWDLLGYEDSEYEKCHGHGVCGFDSHYPEYFPARADFESVVEQLKELNVYTVPYINGRLFDKGLDAWHTKPETQAAAVMLLHGVFADETYGNNVHFAPMCPATAYWKSLLKDITKYVMKTNVTGIYIDQVAAGDPLPCFNPDHDHAPGGGSSWTSGYAEVFEAMRGKAGEDKLFITESNVEQYIGSVDAFLSLVAYENLDDMVPAFQYVYPYGMAITAGAIFDQDDVTKNNGISFIKKMMKMFLFGSQLGWMALGGRDNQKPSMNILEILRKPQYRSHLDAMVRIIKQRMDPIVSELLTEGRVQEPLSEFAHLWTSDGPALLLACNPTDAQVPSTYATDLSEFFPESNLVRVTAYKNGDWVRSSDPVAPGAFNVTTDGKPFSCDLFYVSKNTHAESIDESIPKELTS